MAEGTITLKTKIDEGGINSGLSKIKSGAVKLEKTFAVVGGAATAAFVKVSKTAVDSYAEYEQLVGGVETLFKTSSDVVMDYANQAYQTAGLSANAYMETVTSFSASLLQALGGDTAKAAEYGNQAVIDMSDNANKMGTSMEAIQNAYQGFAKQNFTMLDNLKLGYGGTKTEMERLLKDAENIKKANGEMASYSVDSFADITEAIHVVQENMGITGTTAKEAATTIQGSIGMMKGAWENLLTGMSDTNADIEGLMEKFIDSVKTVFDNLEPVIEKTLSNLPKLVTKSGTKLINSIPGVFDKIVPNVLESVAQLIEAIVNTISQRADTIADTLIKIGKTLIKTITSLIPKMIEAGGKLIKGLVQGITAQMPVLSTAALSITSIFAAIKITNVVQGIVSGFSTINTVLNSYTAAIATNQNVSLLLTSTMTPLQMAVGILTGKVELATAAQAAWNAVRSLDPTVLITTAVVGLTAAVVGAVIAYDSYIEKNSESVIAARAMADAAAEAAEKAQEQADKMANLSEVASATIEDAEAEAYANSVLADELYDLAEQTDLTVQQKERMYDIVDELNGNIDGLNLQIDEETGLLNLSRDAIDEYITKSLEMAKAKAVQDLYTETLKEQYKAQSEAAGNAQKLKEAQDKLNEVSNDSTLTSKEQKKAIKECEEAISKYEEALNGNKNAIQQSQTNMENLSKVAGVALPESWDESKASTQGFFDSLLEQTGQAATDVSSKGNDYGDGYVKGINEKQNQAYWAGWNLGKKALQGTQDAQNSNSPAKETIKLGDYFDQGYIKGIENGMDDAEQSGAKLAENALKGAKLTTKEIANEIATAYKSLNEDTRSEVQKVIDDWQDEENDVLYYEKLYAEESLRIEKEREEKEWQNKLDSAKKTLEKEKAKAKNIKEIREAEAKYEEKIQELHNERMEKEQKEAEDKYLSGLKEMAEKTREISEAQQKDAENLKNKIIDAYKEMSDTAMSDIENLQKTQEKFANKLKNYGNLYNERKINGKTYKTLADIGNDNKTLQEYYDTLMKVKERGDIPAEFFENLRDMGVDEGLEYAKKLLSLKDSKWDEYISDWKEKQELSEKISKDIYKDEAYQLATKINEEFDAMEDEFFGVGETAAENFESGFIDELKYVIKNIKNAINSAFSSVAIPIESLIKSEVVTQDMQGNGVMLNVPALAKGGVIPRAMTALIGENGKEAVIPLENNTGWMDMLADRITLRNGGYNNQIIREEHYNLNETELMTMIYKLASGGKRLNGSSIVEGGA